MALPDLPGTWGEWATGAAVAVMGGLVGIRKIAKVWAGDSRDIQKTQAETDVVTILRSELARMSEANDKLAKLVASLQDEVLQLKGENAAHKRRIESMDFELATLRGPQGLVDSNG